MRGVLEDWRTMGPTEPVRSASHAALRQLRESTRQQKLRDKTQKTQGQTGHSRDFRRPGNKMGRLLAPALHYFKLVAGEGIAQRYTPPRIQIVVVLDPSVRLVA